MRLDRTSLIAASNALLSAAAMGHPWEDGMDKLAHAAGCHSACVWASRGGRPSYIGNRTFSEQGVANINRPGDVPYTDAILIGPRTDQVFVTPDLHPQGERIRRLPFYVDVLSKIGFGRYAGLSLDPGDGSLLRIGLWRGIGDGVFDEAQIQAFDVVARDIRAAVTFARRTRDLIVRERSSVYVNRGEPTFLLGSRGEATAFNIEADDLPADAPLRIRRGRLAAVFDQETRRLDKLVGEAVAHDGRPGSMVLTSATGERYQILALPLRGESLDVFCATRAIATLVRLDSGRQKGLETETAILLSSAFALTERETSVAMLVVQGLAPAGIARRLGIGEGTARNHVKAVLRKVGVHGQVELAALVARYH